jgi:hypothetical protein
MINLNRGEFHLIPWPKKQRAAAAPLRRQAPEARCRDA